MTFAEFCEAVSDTPLNEFQKHTCNAIEEKYRKDGNFDSCVSTVRGGGPRSIICAQLIALFYLYLKYDNMTNGEVIESLFPNVGTNFSNVLDLNLWWNAKYKVKKEEV